MSANAGGSPRSHRPDSGFNGEPRDSVPHIAPNRKGIWGWMFFDWANQPFHTLILTFIFAPYFAASVIGDAVEGQAAWGFAVAAGSLAVAVLAPILGAVADAGGARRPWIISFSIVYVAGVACLWVAAPNSVNPTLVLFFLVIALIGAEFTTVFTNALLPELGTKREIGRISGSGWAMGYCGGLVSLAIVLCFLTPAPGSERTLIGLNPVFGLNAAEGEGARATGPMSAIWYVVFMVPFFLWTPDAPRRPVGTVAVKKGLLHLGRTLLSLPARRSLFAYLLSSMFYRDALSGLYVFGGIYAAGVLGWGTFQLGVFGIVGALTGAIGAWAGGHIDTRRGPRPVIVVTIVVLIVVSAMIISTSPEEVLFIAVGSPDSPSSLPDILFFACGAMIGAAGGSLQAASRSMLVRHAEQGGAAEAFGIYALAGKATAFLAPFLIALATDLSGSQRIGVTPVLLLFAIGLALMTLVDAEGDSKA